MKVRTNEMNERERLVEILKDNQGDSTYYMTDEAVQSVSDVLLANGVIVLPCKVGDTVYEICERRRSGKWQKAIVERVVHGIEIGIDKILTARCGTTTYVYLSRLGETVFLTREEAEKALKGGEQGCHLQER